MFRLSQFALGHHEGKRMDVWHHNKFTQLVDFIVFTANLATSDHQAKQCPATAFEWSDELTSKQGFRLKWPLASEDSIGRLVHVRRRCCSKPASSIADPAIRHKLFYSKDLECLVVALELVD